MPGQRHAAGRVAVLILLACAGIVAAEPSRSAGPQKAQVTILYDAFGQPSALEKDWGYAAYIEYGGKRILFDTGNNPDILARNAKAKGIDLRKLDFVVMSHRHGDHMGGLAYVLRVNPGVKIYAPKENFGVYGADLPSSFYRKDDSLPAEQRYYGGTPPEVMRFGSAWPGANFQLIDQTTEIVPDMHLIALVSDKPGTLELRELSLAIRTPDGVVLVVGCAHPGIEKIVGSAAAIDTRIHLVIGGASSGDRKRRGDPEDRGESARRRQGGVHRSGTLHGRAGVCGAEEGVRREIHLRGSGQPG